MSKKSGHKILRIGLIQNGKILEESLMRAAKPVTIGHGLKKNVLVVPASNLPKTYKLFEPTDGNYQLFFTSKMSGRVSLGDGVHTLQELVSSGKVKKTGSGYVLKLNSRARGKITFGEVTVLFQFVTPPPPRPKPVLPASMRGGWLKGIEPILAAVVALSAIMQIGFVAYVELQDWPEELDANMRVEDRFVKIMADKEPEEPEEPEEKETQEEGEGEPEAKEESTEPAPQPKKEAEKQEDDEPKSAEERAEAEAERRKRMAEKVEKSTILHQIGSVSDEGGSLVDSLSEGAGDTSMNDAFDGSKGMKRGELGAEKSGLDTSGSSDAEGTGSASGIDDLGESSGAQAANEGVDTGDKADEVKVKASIDVKGGSQTVGSGKLDANRISRVVKRGASAIQRCFERELKKNPNVGGKLVITVTIGRAGKVTNVNTQTAIDGQFPSCSKTAIKRWRFPRPKGGDVSFTKTFVLQSSN